MDENAVFHFRQPTEAAIQAFLHTQARFTFTYPEVGATATIPPVHYTIDRTRVCLGTGEAVFRRAKIGLGGWRQFNLGWLRACPADTPIRSGNDIAIVACTFGIWSLHAARIVYVMDELRRFGFAYGTLPGHVERGEERFLVEQNDDDTVWYDIVAFSRPQHLLTKLGFPFVRRLQKRFGRDSAAAMVRFTKAG